MLIAQEVELISGLVWILWQRKYKNLAPTRSEPWFMRFEVLMPVKLFYIGLQVSNAVWTCR